MNRDQLDQAAMVFLQKLLVDMKSHGLNLEARWVVDHLCYRTSSEEDYLRMNDVFASMATRLTESEVNGRMIATYEFEHGFIFGNRRIDLIELPAPKPGKLTLHGFEHIEVVVDLSFENLERSLNPELRTRISRKGMSKFFNPELELELSSTNLKFHHQSLAQVVFWEKHLAIAPVIAELSTLPQIQGSELVVLDEARILVYGPTSIRTAMEERMEKINSSSQEPKNPNPRPQLIFEDSPIQFEEHLRELQMHFNDGSSSQRSGHR